MQVTIKANSTNTNEKEWVKKYTVGAVRSSHKPVKGYKMGARFRYRVDSIR